MGRIHQIFRFIVCVGVGTAVLQIASVVSVGKPADVMLHLMKNAFGDSEVPIAPPPPKHPAGFHKINLWNDSINSKSIFDLDFANETGPGMKSRYFLSEPRIDPDTIVTTTFFVFVQSAPPNVHKRARIRATWANRTLYRNLTDVCVIFVIGRPTNLSLSNESSLRTEARDHDDVLWLNMEDRYDNLTYKGYLAQSWIASSLPTVQYVFKTDDDILLNTFAWLSVIQQLETLRLPRCFILGNIWHHPWLARGGRWTVTKQDYEYDILPSFASGTGYLLTRTSVLQLLQAARRVVYFKRDDPFFTGILPYQLDIARISFPHTSYITDIEDDTDVRRNDVILVNGPKDDLWDATWSYFVKEGYRVRNLTTITVAKDVKLDRHDRMLRGIPPRWNLSDSLRGQLKCNESMSDIEEIKLMI